MANYIEKMIEQSAQQTRFAPNSRYHGVETAVFTDVDGEEVAYVKRRFVPPSSATYQDPRRVVNEGERPDQIAAEALDDPERYWELCDHNLVFRPIELVAEPGSAILLPGNANSTTGAFFPI
mgnify:CR=1 FL=1